MQSLDLEPHGRPFRRTDELVLNLTDCPREGDHLDAARARAAECGRARVGGRARGVDVVDEAHRARDVSSSHDAAAHVSPPLRECRDRAGAEGSARVAGGRLPEAARDCPRARASPFGATVPRSQARSGSPGTCASTSTSGIEIDLGDELGGDRGETPLPALLPGADERPRAAFVHDRGARASEREPAPRAFGAAPHGPRAGRAAALADRGAQSDEGVATGLAERGAGPPTDRAALRKEQLEHTVIVGRYSLRLCEKMRSASWSVSAEPMSYHCPGSRQV